MDIKPLNFVVDIDTWTVYAIDLNLAGAIDSEEAQSNAFVGTRRYASLYRHTGLRPIGVHDDLVSL